MARTAVSVVPLSEVLAAAGAEIISRQSDCLSAIIRVATGLGAGGRIISILLVLCVASAVIASPIHCSAMGETAAAGSGRLIAKNCPDVMRVSCRVSRAAISGGVVIYAAAASLYHTVTDYGYYGPKGGETPVSRVVSISGGA